MTSNYSEASKEESNFGSEEKDSSKTEHESPKTSATTPDIPAFGWSAYAERVNGRFAMVGFSAILLIELLSRESFLSWAGLIK